MAVCPPQIRYLSEGKAVGAKSHKGFVATWNWLLSCIFHLKGGSGVSVRGKWRGAPVIDCQIVAGDGIDVTCVGDGAPYVISSKGGGREVTLRGADDSSVAGYDFTFESAADSNVVATMVEDEDTGAKKVVIGAYYV